MKASWPWPALLAALCLAGPCDRALGRPPGASFAWLPGAVAERDLRAPSDLVVIDPAGSAAVLAGDGVRAPVVWRRDGQAARDAMARFDATFVRTREVFRQALEKTYGRPLLDERDTDATRFRTFRDDFQRGNPLLPVNLPLAQTWARGFDGESVRARWAALLSDLMDGRILVADRPVGEALVASVGPHEIVTSWASIEGRVQVAAPDQLLTLDEAGQELRRRLDPLDRPAAGFLAALLRTNVVEDAPLTGLLLSERYPDRVQTRAYASGEVIVAAGQTVDRWGALAAGHLSRAGMLAVEPPASGPGGHPSPADGVMPAPGSSVGLLAGVIGAGLVLGLASALWWLRSPRRRPPTTAALGGHPPVEARAVELRAALLPHLARELKDRLVGVLFAQRAALLQNEAIASRRVADLEARLARLQPAIAERIRGYERRIVELERELEIRDQETRELIRAKLVLARQDLEAEVTRNRIQWN